MLTIGRMSIRSRLPILTDFLGPRLQPEAPGSDVLGRVGSGPPDLVQNGFPDLRGDEIALMFSGGLDSTATAVMLAERFRRVHLITYRNGYGHYYHHRTEDRVRELNRRLGDRFVWTLISTKHHFDRILVDHVLADYAEYRSGFVWFMGCKMAMHMRSAVYCLEHGLLHMTDGSNSDTDEMVEQSLLSLSLITHFYDDHTVDFGTPVYDVHRAESREIIAEMDLKMGVQVMDRHLCIQPTCIAGELYYLPYLFFNKPVKHDEELVSRFIEVKARVCRQLMAEYFRAKGVDLDDLLARRRGQLHESAST